MDKRRLKELIKRYQTEVYFGYTTHLDDLIAAMVISDLTEIRDNYMTLYSTDDITLSKLLGQTNPELIKVPSRHEMNNNKLRFNSLSKSKSLLLGYEETKAANTWMDMMLTAGMIKENEMINPSEYILDNFIKDYNLREILPVKYTRRRKQKDIGNNN